MARALPRVRRTRTGAFQLRLEPEEREVFGHLIEELRELLGAEDPVVERLFPPGYADDPELARQYRELVHSDLNTQRLASLQVVEDTLEAKQLDAEQMGAWLTVVNDLRLVLGTRLDVTEDMAEDGVPDDDPRAPAFAVYGFLTWLEWQVVEVLAQALPEEAG
jgi:hypothetical protein